MFKTRTVGIVTVATVNIAATLNIAATKTITYDKQTFKSSLISKVKLLRKGISFIIAFLILLISNTVEGI